MGTPVVLGGCRTPFVKSFGKARKMTARQLGSRAALEALLRLDLEPDRIDEVILGNVAGPADAPNIARVVANDIGIPHRVPAMTVHRNCASAMEAVIIAADRIRSGQSRCVLVGGVESMSRVPFLFADRTQDWLVTLSRARSLGQKLSLFGQVRPSYFKPVPGLMKGLVDPSCDLSMGQTAEKVAGEHGVTREDQDAFALESNRRAVAARDKLREEICELYVPPRYEVMLENDDGPRPDSSLEKLARLRPVFEKRDGTVTAGNSSQITDGAVCLVLMDEDLARAEGRKSLGRIRAHATVGLDPTRMGLGPAHALVKLMDQEGVTLSDIELMEINEAFAAQVIAVQRALASDTFCQEHFDRKAVGEIPSDRLNVNGGAVALGHPVGASGARIIHTLLLEMGRRDLGLGAASLCVGGGQGQAVLVER